MDKIEPTPIIPELVLEQKRHHPSLIWGLRLLPWVAGAAFLSLIPSLKTDGLGMGTFIFVLILGFPVILILTLAAHLGRRILHTPRKLILNDQGMCYQTAFYALKCSLQNLSCLAENPGKNQEKYLLLHKSADVTDVFLFAPGLNDRLKIPLAHFDQQSGAALDLWLNDIDVLSAD